MCTSQLSPPKVLNSQLGGLFNSYLLQCFRSYSNQDRTGSGINVAKYILRILYENVKCIEKKYLFDYDKYMTANVECVNSKIRLLIDFFVWSFDLNYPLTHIFLLSLNIFCWWFGSNLFFYFKYKLRRKLNKIHKFQYFWFYKQQFTQINLLIINMISYHNCPFLQNTYPLYGSFLFIAPHFQTVVHLQQNKYTI